MAQSNSPQRARISPYATAMGQGLADIGAQIAEYKAQWPANMGQENSVKSSGNSVRISPYVTAMSSMGLEYFEKPSLLSMATAATTESTKSDTSVDKSKSDTTVDKSKQPTKMAKNEDKMKEHFLVMTEAAKSLKNHLITDDSSSSELKGVEFEEHLTDIRHYSQIVWDSLFEFVQYVTCSTHPVASKIKWIDYADQLIDQTFDKSACSLGKSYHEIMKTLTQMARIDPFCRPESYIDFFGKSTFGVSLDSLVLNQEKILKEQADKESQFAGQVKTMLPWFVAGCVVAIVLNSIIECR